MRQAFTPWLLLLAVELGGVGATYLACPGCIDRNRGNYACEWTSDSTFPIDTRNPAHRKHLIADAQLAEELAVRYADAEYADRFGGVRAHGGLLDDGRVRNECMARLVAAIANNHAVTSEQVAVARAARNHIFDFLVVLLFLPLYGTAAVKVCAFLRNPLSADAAYVRLVTLTLASASMALLGILSFSVWRAVMEGMRVGNPDGHMSTFRAAHYWTHWYVAALMAGGVLLFWLVAAFWYRWVNGNLSRGVLEQLSTSKPTAGILRERL